MKIDFTKMSGAGNDFVVIDNRHRIIKDTAAFAKNICDRHRSVGADGLLVLESSEKATYRMMYYNADGSYGGMCGNGGRCIAMYAFLNTIAKSNHTFEALDHIYSVSIESENVLLQMINPAALKLNQHMVLEKKNITYHSVDTGAPHIVLDFKELNKKIDFDTFDVQRWGKMLRRF